MADIAAIRAAIDVVSSKARDLIRAPKDALAERAGIVRVRAAGRAPTLMRLRRPALTLLNQAAATSMRLGWTCGCFGMRTSSTPFAYRAATPSCAAVSGRLKRRKN